MQQLKYGTAIVLHDGQGHFRAGLIFATRYDLGGPDDYPVVTGVSLDPKFAPPGAARGNITDAVQVFHDLKYVESADLAGYNFTPFDTEVLAEIVPKKVVLAAPVAPVLIEPPVAASPVLVPDEGPTAIVGGVKVPVRPLENGSGTYAAELTADQKASEVLANSLSSEAAEIAKLKQDIVEMQAKSADNQANLVNRINDLVDQLEEEKKDKAAVVMREAALLKSMPGTLPAKPGNVAAFDSSDGNPFKAGTETPWPAIIEEITATEAFAGTPEQAHEQAEKAEAVPDAVVEGTPDDNKEVATEEHSGNTATEGQPI